MKKKNPAPFKSRIYGFVNILGTLNVSYPYSLSNLRECPILSLFVWR